MYVSRRSWRTLVLFAATVAAVAACQENLPGGAACPALCADTLAVKDTTIVGAQAFDTVATVLGMPPLGTEPQLLLYDYAQGSGHVSTVAVLRFDSLVRVFTDTDTTKPPRPFDRVDSTSVSINILSPADTTQDTVFVPDTVTFLVYDVDTSATDFDTAAVHARFSGTPIATRVVPPDSVKGTIGIPLDTGWVGDHVRQGKRIRLGLRVTSRRGVRVKVGSNEGGSPASLRYFGHAGTSKLFVVRSVNTVNPGAPVLSSLADYTLVTQGSPAPPPGVLVAGGMPASRVYMRLAIPSSLIDSTATIVRATLLLHQLGDTSFISADSFQLNTNVVRARPSVTDVAAATLLATAPAAVGVSSVPQLVLPPESTRPDTIPLVGLFILWKRDGPAKTQRAIVLQAAREGIDPRQYYFWGPSAPVDSLRPRIHITYIPKSGFGLP